MANREDDLDRELRDHLDLEAEERGDADAARRAFGNLARVKEDVREAWGWTTIQRIAQDLRYAFRQMARNKGFTAAAVLTLAFGLGATTAMFSIVNSVLLEPLRYRDPGRLFLARTLPPARAKMTRDFPINAAQFDRWRQYCRGCDQMALAKFDEFTLIGAGDPAIIPGMRISLDFFSTLGVQPAIGRNFVSADGEWGNVILTDALWRSRFASDPSIIGRKIGLNGDGFIVIGVMPPDLHLPKGEDWGGFFGPAEAPMVFFPIDSGNYKVRPVGNLNYSALIRLKPGVSREQGMAELNSLLADIYREYQLETSITLIPLQQQVTRNARSALWLLLGTVGVVLLIVCVNVGNLMLVRTSGRYREAGVRLALGASRGWLFAFVLEEALLLVAIGGALGLGLAAAGLKAFAAAAPALPRIDEVQIDWRVLCFSGAAIVFSTMICGLFPAWKLARTEPIESLKAGSAASTEGRGKLRLREAMVSVEVALSTVLLIVGGLLMVSFFHVLRVEKGFDVANIITQDISFLNPKYAHGAHRRVAAELLAKLRELPGVDVAAATNHLPLLGEDWVGELTDPDQPPRSADQSELANFRFVSPGYWQAMGIPLKRGRFLDDSDQGKPIAVISERAAQFMWPNENPLGKHLEGMGKEAPKLEIVGVVGEVRGAGLDHPLTMMVYEHQWRMEPLAMSLIVRTRADPARVAAAIRALLSHADPEMPIPQARTMQQIVEESVAPRRFQMYLAVAFAIAALFLASLGIYGVISFTVARRTPEMGIRIALGASAGELMVMILRQGMVPVFAGLTAGLLGAILVGHVISSELYGIAPRDPATMAGVAVVLLAVAVSACWFPARRATKIDPLVALRFE